MIFAVQGGYVGVSLQTVFELLDNICCGKVPVGVDAAFVHQKTDNWRDNV